VAEILPFKGVRYNQSLVKDLASLICPPYDIITPRMQQELYDRSEYNFARLEYARELPNDTAEDNKFARSAATLEKWLKEGVLQVDHTPAIYLHDHYFTYEGKEYRRRGITVRVRLENWGKMVVRPHEGTLRRPRSERLDLLWACQANTSPILSLFEDNGNQISPLLAAQVQNEPIISLSSTDGESHYVWAITEPVTIEGICSSLADQPLYIADGHHRYESALTHQRERLVCSGSASGDEPFNFVMMTLVDFADPGLIILPLNRLVRGIPRSTLDGLMAGLEPFFGVEELPFGTLELWQQLDHFLAAGANEVRLAILGVVTERLLLLKVRDAAAVSKMLPQFHSELYSKLDISIVDHLILEKLLGMSSDMREEALAYSYDKREAVNKVLEREYQLALLLSPVKADAIKTIADAGDRMPKKSTYFYPKLPSGLVFNRLV